MFSTVDDVLRKCVTLIVQVGRLGRPERHKGFSRTGKKRGMNSALSSKLGTWHISREPGAGYVGHGCTDGEMT